MPASLESIINFGANVSFTPRHDYRPENEPEVLDSLRRNRHEQIRVIGRLHAWSRLVESTDVIISLENPELDALTDEAREKLLLELRQSFAAR
ncbi:MAG: hypothetical protein JNL67_08130 [Planctomycetaceae bacterium]|nr:hypothetical protein [Planctomycetaceae bacterium]